MTSPKTLKVNHSLTKITTTPLPPPVDPLAQYPPYAIISKWNLPVNLPLRDAVCDINVATFFDAAWANLTNGGTKLRIYFENCANWKKGLRAGVIYSGYSFDEYKYMTHKFNKKTTPQKKLVEAWTPLYLAIQRPTADPQINPGPATDLTERLAVGTVCGNSPIHCRSVNPRAYYGPTSGEKTKWQPAPLECLGREIYRGKVKNNQIQDANHMWELPVLCYQKIILICLYPLLAAINQLFSWVIL